MERGEIYQQISKAETLDDFNKIKHLIVELTGLDLYLTLIDGLTENFNQDKLFDNRQLFEAIYESAIEMSKSEIAQEIKKREIFFGSY